MKKSSNLFKRVVATVGGTLLALCITVVPVKADTATDAAALAAAQAQYQALIQSPQYQALLAAQQEQLKIIQEYQLKMLQNQQNAVLLQYQAACQAQEYLLQQQTNAFQRALLLQQIQNMQTQQYQSLIQGTGLDYQSMLMENYTKYQNAGLDAFLGYNGY